MSSLTHILLLVSAAGVCMGWIPVLLRFFRNWTERKNPISMAVCALIMFVMYITSTVFWWTSDEVTNPLAILSVRVLLSWFVCLNFYLAFVWSSRRFRSQRQKEEGKE